MPHYSAKPSHYDKEAGHYDAFNEENSKLVNRILESTLNKYGVKTVLDLSCGTGSQVFWLAKRGYEVIGCDINSKMLKVATSKAREEQLNVKLLSGDMRTLKVGKFDAVITIFNAVGHLTKFDFEIAMRNIRRNLKDGGLYVFDINNLSYLMKDDRITNLTIDWQKTIGDTKVRDIQHSTINKNGILASHTISYVQEGSKRLKISRSTQTLQVYTAKQIREMLHRNGFEVIVQRGIDGSKFVENETDRILTLAKKRLDWAKSGGS